MKAKLKAVITPIIDAVDSFFAYIMTMCGVIISPLMPSIKSGGAVQFSDLHLSWFKLALAALFAVVVTGISEMRGQKSEDPATQAKAAAAKRNNFWIRMAVAFSVGAGWGQLM